MSTKMKAELSDIQWLRENQPRLLTGIHAPAVVGTLSISAYYDATANRLVSDPQPYAREHHTYLYDEFVLFISITDKDQYGWPKVYDAAGRYRSIANRYRVSEADLHFYTDGYACLGLPDSRDSTFTIRNFVESMVEPFFYRLAYVDLYGIAAARSDLWGEYSHGRAGLQEHQQELQHQKASMLSYQKNLRITDTYRHG